MQRIAVVGVGLLGSAVASRLLAGGFTVKGYDTRADQLTALSSRGLEPAPSLKDAAASAEAVFTILPTPDAVETTIVGPGGLLSVMNRSAPLIQMSTISPTLTRRLADAARSAGIGFLDAPMSGTSAMVERGDCTIFAGGDAALIAACRPVFAAVATRTTHVGPVGSASLAKLAANLLVALNTAALAEALVLGTKGGLPPQRLLDILKDSAGASRMVDVRGPLMVEHRFEPQMKLELFLKDFRLMLEEAQRLGVALPLTSLTQQLCTAAVSDGRGGDDLAVLITTLEKMAGLDPARSGPHSNG
jgi:3-hydroxyisobutyrate dehydrogenase-like beta-hydroxyacid dehydrogenase